ncbi:MAG: cell division protein FtsL [Lachnospiraceae bacterium]|nr:cell division protein FtsL [Lachnospiraceae bacterium]
MAATRTRTGNAYYIEGNTVRKARPAYGEAENRRLRSVRQVRARRANRLMSLGYLLFLTLSLAAAGIVLAYYIMLQTQLSGSAGRISSLEKQLGAITKENDEAYNRVNGNVDLEEIRRIAIQEYGMRYVAEGQIVTYSDGGGSDYVRQKADIPDAGQ